MAGVEVLQGRALSCSTSMQNSLTWPSVKQDTQLYAVETYIHMYIYIFIYLFILIEKGLLATAAISTTSICFASLPDTEFLFQHIHYNSLFEFFVLVKLTIRWKSSPVSDRKNRGKHPFKSCCLLSWQPFNKLCYSFFTST